MTNRPSGCPVDSITIDLPTPPSVNLLWRSNRGRVHKSEKYFEWQKRADDAIRIVFAGGKQPKTITGPFEASITIQTGSTKGDLDNFFKAVLDYAQRIELISNDKFAVRLVAEWGDAPAGCRLVLTPVAEAA